MRLTNAQRKAIKLAIAQRQSEQRAATLRATTRPAQITPDLERETQGMDPWNTRAAPGQSFESAWNRHGLVS